MSTPSSNAIITRAIRVNALGGTEVLKFAPNDQTANTNTIGPRQVLLKHSFAGINMIDKYVREGLYPHKPFPYIPGNEGAGAILAVGSEVSSSEFQVGKRVGFFTTNPSIGSFTSHAIHNVDELIPYPKVFEAMNEDADKVMASILIQGLTAHYLTDSCFNVNENTSCVLLNAAAGGTGSLLAQIAKIRGAKKVIGICGGPEKAKLAKEISKCDDVIDYHQNPDWVSQVKALAPNGVVDVFYDSVGKTTFEQDCFSVLKRRGAMVTFGNASGPVPPIAPLTLTKYQSISLQRPKLHDFVDREDGELNRRMSEVAQWIADKKLTVSISKVVKLEDAAEAMKQLESGKSTGKILLDCQS